MNAMIFFILSYAINPLMTPQIHLVTLWRFLTPTVG